MLHISCLYGYPVKLAPRVQNVDGSATKGELPATESWAFGLLTPKQP